LSVATDKSRRDRLRRRNHMLKGAQAVAPVFIERSHRIVAILLCHFLAMPTEALIERDIRASMKDEGLIGIPPRERQQASDP